MSSLTLRRNAPLLLAAAFASHGLWAQSKPTAPTAPADEPVTLSPFEINADKDNGYATSETLAGTRIRTSLDDVASSISVVTKQFLQDTGATDSSTLLQYTTNAEVAGTRGTYTGLGNGTSVDETPIIRNPEQGNRVRGLAAADNTRDFFVTDIPWDSYNVDRIDIQRGPNAILFGLGSPAGIINASLHNAEFSTFGSITDRVGSYGSTRESLDANIDIFSNVLAVRVDGLINDQKYEQKQAFQNDKRLSGAIRFDPDLFKNPDFHTSIKLKIERGDISADRPRTVTPSDSITQWFRPVDNTSLNGGLGKLAINSAYGVTAQPQTVNPWLTAAANQQQPIWFQDGATDATYQIYGGYINNGFIDNTGKYRGSGNNALGQTYSDVFYGLTSLSQFAINAKLPNYQYGQYRQQSLTDPTVFNFYKNLIDGPTSSQFEKWTAVNLDLQQTAFNDRLGFEFTYDDQRYKRGGQSLFTNPTITIDVLEHFQDGSVNPNFGRPYIEGGPGSGNSYSSNRKYVRGSLFGELRAADFIHNDFLVKLLGHQRFNGVFSNEKYNTENRTWQEYANSVAWDAYWNSTNGLSNSITNRPPVTVVYLGPSLANASSAAGANIPGVTAPITIQGGGVYSFSSTWNAPTVSPSAPWTIPASLTGRYDPTVATTQASNPANYVGWNSNFQDSVISDVDGNNPTLTRSAQKALRVTDSTAGSWQGYFWNDALVPTLGWRYDEVKSRSATALPVTLNRGELNLNPAIYTLPDQYAANQIVKNHSLAGGAVAHLNKLFGEKDPLPINVSLSYNKSDNFQVTDIRHDVLGSAIANPTGNTREYGLTFATKDDRFSFKITHYKTSITNGSTPLDTSNLIGTITQGLKFRNVFLYQLSGYTWDTREQTVDQPGQRYFWTPAYINSTGRPVADLNGNPLPVPAGATLESSAQADAHRDATINAWNAIQKTLDSEGFFQAWNFTPTTLSALTDRSTYAATLTTAGSPDGKPIPAAQYIPAISSLASYSATAPQGLTVTSDSESKGYEFEFTANPTKNWRITFNAAETTAIRSNVGGAALDSLVSYMNTQMAGVAGDLRQFNGNYVPGNEIRQNWANFYGQYVLLKLQEGADSPELRKWRYNIITNYSFDHGVVKGMGVGAAYRWQDRVAIGYPVISGAGGTTSFDLSKPYYGPSEDALDLWVSYGRKITKKIAWSVQLNVYNVGKKDGLVPISVEPDGHTWAAVRIAPTQEWQLTNTFSF